MANLRGVGGMKQLNLIASWKDSQVTEKDGKVTGAYLTVEKDQTMISQKDAKAGKADTNPYLESHEAEGTNGKYTSHNVWYSQSQIDAMKSIGAFAKQEDDRNAVAFKADVQKSKNEKTGESRIIVLTPKDASKAATPEDKAKIEKYNEAHPFGPSDNKKFDGKSLVKQEKITAIAKANRPVRDVSASVENEKAAEAEPEME